MNVDIVESDEEAPPELVDAKLPPQDEVPPRKVPITIVTGKNRIKPSIPLAASITTS